mgnify:CR=1 FL=1
MNNRIFIGIDPGIAGGIAFLYDDTYYAKKCPSTVQDMADEIKLLKEMSGDIAVYAMIEKVHSFPGNSGRSMFTFGMNYGEWLGILAAHSIPYLQISPHKWQKHFGTQPKNKKDRKNNLKHLAQQRYPDIKITHTVADAILIATYLRETNTK